jgi:hypothetical protein
MSCFFLRILNPWSLWYGFHILNQSHSHKINTNWYNVLFFLYISGFNSLFFGWRFFCGWINEEYLSSVFFSFFLSFFFVVLFVLLWFCETESHYVAQTALNSQISCLSFPSTGILVSFFYTVLVWFSNQSDTGLIKWVSCSILFSKRYITDIISSSV